MKKIGLFYGTATAKTAAVAKKIKEAFGEDIVDIIPVEQSEEKEFNANDISSLALPPGSTANCRPTGTRRSPNLPVST